MHATTPALNAVRRASFLSQHARGGSSVGPERTLPAHHGRCSQSAQQSARLESSKGPSAASSPRMSTPSRKSHAPTAGAAGAAGAAAAGGGGGGGGGRLRGAAGATGRAGAADTRSSSASIPVRSNATADRSRTISAVPLRASRRPRSAPALSPSSAGCVTRTTTYVTDASSSTALSGEIGSFARPIAVAERPRVERCLGRVRRRPVDGVAVNREGGIRTAGSDEYRSGTWRRVPPPAPRPFSPRL